MKVRKLKKQIVKLKDNFYVNINSIDTILFTNVDPRTNTKLGKDVYIVYLKNSAYSYTVVSEKECMKYDLKTLL